MHWPALRDSFARLLDSSDDRLLDRAVSLYRERFAIVGLFENALHPSIPRRSRPYARLAAVSMSLPALRVVMAGDRWHDIIGAKNGGVYSLGVSYGYSTEWS